MIPSQRPEKFFKIGEVMQFTGLSRQTLHNYTMMGLIAESRRTESGHRLYPESVFDRLGRIALLKRHRTLREVRMLLEQDDRRPAEADVALPAALIGTGPPARPGRTRTAAPAFPPSPLLGLRRASRASASAGGAL